MAEVNIIGIDLAKRSFQLHGAGADGSVAFRKKLGRERLLDFLALQPRCVVAMEACASAHYWGREILKLGHEAKLIPPIYVKPFVGGNKNDVHDARAIWTAVQQPSVKTVAIKSEEQQAILALHRVRQQLVKFRTAQINGLRGLLTEYGEVMLQGRAGMRRGIGLAPERGSRNVYWRSLWRPCVSSGCA